MNALADAAFLTSSDPAYSSSPSYGQPASIPMNAVGQALPQGMVQMATMAPSSYLATAPQHNLPAGNGRHLQILDHTVHRIDNHTKPSGEEEKEMVVSNLRHFTLKIGVLDPRYNGTENELPLKVHPTSPPVHRGQLTQHTVLRAAR